ncbi:hypothetical protein RND81_06G043900 [Saponaria officinalis]|uniref:FHA domain-containing protein n=1 Tax=Saponaria officinalis TaxID=3572 RepID=A0AAW1K6H5_SAPOF
MLIIEKGPRSGETLKFNSRSTIRLGRVMRRKNLTVKDPGISSKHLSIEFDLNFGKWIITDLDSSNGTILNSSQLKPLSPFVIDDGDVINVGETTLIKVWIVEFGEIGGKLPDSMKEVRVRVGKGIENRANGDCFGGGEIGGNVSVKDVEGKVEGGMKTRRTRSSRKEVEESVSLEMPVKRTRSAKIVEDVDGEEGNVGVVESVKTYGGRGKRKMSSRRSKNVETVMARKDEEVENVGVVDNKRTRGGRGRKKKTDVKELDKAIDSNKQEDEINEGFLGENVCEQVEVSLFAREQPCAESMYDTIQLGEGDMLEVEAEAGGALSLNQKTISEPFDEVDQESEPKDEANIGVLEVEARENVDDRAPQDEIMVGVEKQTPDKLESYLASEDQIMEESLSGEIPEETNTGYRGGITDREPVPAPGLEKMTLGEWFDYLEAYLSKQIYDVTDKIIDDMRKKAK